MPDLTIVTLDRTLSRSTVMLAQTITNFTPAAAYRIGQHDTLGSVPGWWWGIFEVSMSELIKVKTISAKHVEQLTPEHYWDGEYDFTGKKILGRIANDGFLLVQYTDKSLHRISPIAYQDWQMQKLGCWKVLPGGKREYAPTPHTEYSQKAKAAYNAIPQIFVS